MMSETMMEPKAGSETLRVVSNERMRERLKKVAAIAEAALANQPHEHDQCWEHLRLALGKIETEMLIHKAEKPVKPRETPLDPNAPEMVRGGEQDEKKAIGNFAGVGKVVSYAIDEDAAVTVTARTTDGRIWMFKGIRNGEMAIMGTILGGRGTAKRYCKFIRNGIVSRANRLYHAHHKAKKETT